MQMAEQFDISTLAWVKGEIDETLKQARIALERYVEDLDDETHVAECIDYIHQVAGTLQMVELRGAAMFANEVEQFAITLQQGKIEGNERAYELLMRAILQLPDYLESLLDGNADNPAELVPLLNELREVRGEKQLDNAQFFRANLTAKPPENAPVSEQGVNSQLAAKKLHRFYLTALSKIIKATDVEANLKTAATVIDKLYAFAEAEWLRRLLWISQAFFEALRDNSIELNRQSKPLLGKLEHHIKQLSVKGEEGARTEAVDMLMQSMLYLIANAQATGEHASAVRLAFDLDSLLPGGEVGLGGMNAELKQTVSADIMEELTRVKDTFDIFVRSDRSNPESLGVLADSLKSIAETLSLLQEEALRQTLLEQVDVIHKLVAGESDTTDDTLMGIAGAVLAVESALRDWGSSALTVKADASEEQVDDSETSPQAVAEHQRVTRQVMKEAKDDLTRVREVMNTYLENPQDKESLKHVPMMLHNITGSLTMLSYKRVAQVLISTRVFIEKALINDDSVPEQEKLDALADAVMSVEYYLEAFVKSRVHPGSVLDVAERAVEVLGYPIGSVTDDSLTPETESPDLAGIEVFESGEEEKNESQEDASSESQEDAPSESQEDTPSESQEDAPSEDAIVVPEQESTSGSASEPVGAVEETASELQSDTSSATEAEEGPDDEIMEIFLEEAEEEMENISRLLPAWISDPSDESKLGDIRRSFHTLKGSGRMVGATAVGEFAWAFENMLNRVIDGTLSISATVFDLLEQSQGALTELIEQFRSGKVPESDIDGLREMAFEIAEHGGLKTQEEPVRKPELQKADEANEVQLSATEMPELDPVLLEIYAKETEGHIQELERYVTEWSEGGSHKVTEALIRALHTLQGSSRMAGVKSVADTCASLEKYAKTLQANKQSVDEKGIEALETCIGFVKSMLAFLMEGKGETLPDASAAKELADSVYAEVQHMEQAAHAQPEAGLASKEESHASGERGEETITSDEDAGETTVYEAASSAKDDENDTAGGATEQNPFDLGGTEAVTDELEAEQVETPTPAEIFHDEHDNELVEIFLEEAGDILDTSEETLQAWVDNPDDHSLVEALQRQLHTLKGGARMAGIKAVGDLSHSLESTFEAVEDGQLQRTPQMMDLLQLAHDRLVTMLEQVRNQEDVVPGDDLIRKIEILGRGGVPEQLDSAEPAPSNETTDLGTEVSSLTAHTEEKKEVATASDGEDPLSAVEEAIAEFELSHSNWQREVDNQTAFEQLINNATSLSINCGESGVEELLSIAVAVEKMLETIRDGHLPASKKANDKVSSAMDRLRLIIRQSRESVPLDTGRDVITDINEMITRSKATADIPASKTVKKAPSGTKAAASDTTAADTGKFESAKDNEGVNKRRGARIQHEMVRVRADLLDNLVNFAGEVSIYRSRVEQQIGSFGSNIAEMDQTVDRLRGQVRQFEIENEAQIESRREEAQRQGYEDFDPLEFDRFTSMQQLSRSMAESLSDLVSIEDILVGLTRETETLLLQQSRVNTELQESLVHTRMVPLVENAPRLRRIVRQTASELGKRAALKFEGAEVEMDRNVVERMLSPLEHMLRNSIAHGIESNSSRKKAGKPEEGTITISLSREGSEIIIRVSDDGAGINVDMVKKKAIDRGLMKPDAKISDKEAVRFILESGFSTAESLNQIAGRGVGMDVVNSEIKQLGGVMNIDTNPGKGTTFTVRLPLTLSVSRSLLVEVANDTYAIPLLSISGIERIDTAELKRLLSEDTPTYNWLGDDYDLMHLSKVLGAREGVINSELMKQPLLLARSGDNRIAFAVDNLIGSREIVVKSLGPQLSTLQDLAGATILADGNVALIIDMPALMRRGLAQQGSKHDAKVLPVEEVEREPIVMVVDDSITVRKVTERLLKRHNMKCITAKDGVDALAVLEESMPDVMLLDIEMPRMDGFELATHMRNSDRFADVPIIMITSRTGDKHRQRAMDIGVNIYMGKPYTEVDLLENIESLIPNISSGH
ncbi:MAG: Hpt domain-containing protein [Pseudomonadota bacterium]